MAVHAQFVCSESMGFLPSMWNSQDWPFSSVMGIDDNALFFQENSNLQQFGQAFQLLGPICDNNNPFINQLATTTGPSSSSTSSTSHGLFSIEFSQFLASELEKQKAEMEYYLHLQNERLITVLREETRQRGVILHRYASKLMSLILQKENEMAIANKRTMELQECLRRSEIESKAWQQKATENEAMVIDLTNKINEERERMYYSNMPNGAEDAESLCDSSSSTSMVVRRDQKETSPKVKKTNCKLCHVQSSCILFFPCKHLCCCCKACEAVLELCPVCKSVKETSMEVFLV